MLFRRHGECRRLEGALNDAQQGTSRTIVVRGEAGMGKVDEIGKNKPDDVVAALLGSADDLGVVGDDPYYGKGRINVATALGAQAP